MEGVHVAVTLSAVEASRNEGSVRDHYRLIDSRPGLIIVAPVVSDYKLMSYSGSVVR